MSLELTEQFISSLTDKVSKGQISFYLEAQGAAETVDMVPGSVQKYFWKSSMYAVILHHLAQNCS